MAETQCMKKMAELQLVKNTTEKHKGNVVLVLDLRFQYTHLITRWVRGLSIISFSLPARSSLGSVKAINTAVIILSGRHHSVHKEGSLTEPDGFFDYTQENAIAVLGVCYGLQLIVNVFGGEVKSAESREYGRMQENPVKTNKLFGNMADDSDQTI